MMRKTIGSLALSTLSAVALVSGTVGRADDLPSMVQFERTHQLNQIHYLNQNEIQVSKMAQVNALSAAVKDMAGRLITDHQAADKMVQDLATKENVMLQDFQVASDDKALSDYLAKFQGADFDRAYLMSMEMGHKAALQSLQMISDNSKDAPIRDLARNLMPKVKMHEKMAMSLEKTPGSMAGTAAGTTSD